MFLPALFFTYGVFQKNQFLDGEENENSYVIRVIGSNIGLERFYDETQTETIIEELISISSPEKKKDIFYLARGNYT